MKIEDILINKTTEAVRSLYSSEADKKQITFQKTNKEFEGDLTLVVFPFIKLSKRSPEETAKQIGEFLKTKTPEVAEYNVVKGFLNLVIDKSYWLGFLKEIQNEKNWGHTPVDENSKTIMVEYSSPNTNKPLHLGHIRNNLLGYSVSEILKANGNKVVKVNLVNDRGIHICKSMLAWKKWGDNETPESSGMKGDHLVGKYYVEFDKQVKSYKSKVISEGLSEEEAEKQNPLMKEVQEMLRKWEAGDKETIELWKMMNGWVYKGFEETYKMLGVDFDKIYYESNTYLLGKKAVEEGLSKKVFFKKEDGSVRIDLTSEGLDEKVLLRSDGTSVYITQDIGTAIERLREFPQTSKFIYTVGNEQDYHFKILFKTLKKLGYQWADECYHLSYGMVELPEGKMKSREGTAVDADDLIKEMTETAEAITKELGKVEDLNNEDAKKLYKTIGLGALKYFILKVDPKKKMLFDPKESIDFNGHTGPFIQYTYARIRSVLRKAKESLKFEVESLKFDKDISVNKKEKDIIKLIYDFPAVINEAANSYSPANIANYVYELVKEYNSFYHDIAILKEENKDLLNFRLLLSQKTGEVIQSSMRLLGIEVPEKM